MYMYRPKWELVYIFAYFFLYLLIFVGNTKIKTENAQRRLGVFQGTKKDLGGTGG